MKKTKQLANDLLEDSISPEFRAALLDKTFQSARRRKRIRRVGGAVGAFVVLGICMIMWLPRDREISSRKDQNSYLIAAQRNPANDSLAVVDKLRLPQEINDDELLALAGNKPVALIRKGAHEAEFVFLDEREK